MAAVGRGSDGALCCAQAITTAAMPGRPLPPRRIGPGSAAKRRADSSSRRPPESSPAPRYRPSRSARSPAAASASPTHLVQEVARSRQPPRQTTMVRGWARRCLGMKRLRGVAERRGSFPKIAPRFQANFGGKAEGGGRKGEGRKASRRVYPGGLAARRRVPLLACPAVQRGDGATALLGKPAVAPKAPGR